MLHRQGQEKQCCQQKSCSWVNKVQPANYTVRSWPYFTTLGNCCCGWNVWGVHLCVVCYRALDNGRCTTWLCLLKFIVYFSLHRPGSEMVLNNNHLIIRFVVVVVMMLLLYVVITWSWCVVLFAEESIAICLLLVILFVASITIWSSSIMAVVIMVSPHYYYLCGENLLLCIYVARNDDPSV